MKAEKSLEDQFLEYLENYRKLIAKVARAYCNDPEEQKDLIQDIIIQLWNAYPRYNPKWSIATWTYRIAINVSISSLRKRSTRKKTQGEFQEGLENIAESSPERDEKLDQLYQFINLLKPIDKAIIILQLEGCKNPEIAEVMGLSVTNVATKKQRIKETLKSFFESKKLV
ncbi:MAG: sigma-70 family RNA polymerase sigma factor [Bacteroidetes bacterium]|nr:sigma-70 family RNA polymerase sigma factor [Bacteroidota bacterium]